MRSAQAISAKEQARRLVLRKFAPGLPRKKATKAGKISSVGTKRIVEQHLKIYLDWRANNGLQLAQQDNRLQLCAYLEERAEVVRQATQNQSRNALQLAFGIRLPILHSQVETIRSRRSYTADEIARVIQHQSERNALATVIALGAGLRAHELATLRKADELSPSSHREWDPRRFLGLPDFRLYVVVGKGGLRRQVAIPKQLAEMLEQHRLPAPRTVNDRGIFYDLVYDIGFGQAFSQSFADASKAALGFSRGAHGLRHGYTKSRTNDLRRLGLTFAEAQSVVSQELGHFRPSITLAYYR